MTDITAGDGVEGFLKRADRDLRSLKTAVGRARVPRVCTSITRPSASNYQPGVGVFETDTGNWLIVNADSTDYLVFKKYVTPPAPLTTLSTARPAVGTLPPGTRFLETDTGYALVVNADSSAYLVFRPYVAPPAYVDATASISYGANVGSRNNSNRVGKQISQVTYNLQLVTSAALGADALLCTLPDGYRPPNTVNVEGPVFVLTTGYTAAGVAHVYITSDGSGQVRFGRMLPVGGGASTTTLPSGSILTATFNYQSG